MSLVRVRVRVRVRVGVGVRVRVRVRVRIRVRVRVRVTVRVRVRFRGRGRGRVTTASVPSPRVVRRALALERRLSSRTWKVALGPVVTWQVVTWNRCVRVCCEPAVLDVISLELALLAASTPKSLVLGACAPKS